MKKHILSLLLFIGGLSIIIFPHAAQKVNKQLHEREVQQFHREMKSKPPLEISQVVSEVKKCNESIFKNDENVHDPFTDDYDPGEYKDCEKVQEQGDHFASLEIPTLDLKIPIYLGATNENLAKGVGQLEGSSIPAGGENTHTVLAGHRGMGTKEMFRHLDVMQAGDVFYIHTFNETLTYTVYDVKIILPHETDSLMIREGKDLATLFSCHPYPTNTHRLVVYGERIENDGTEWGYSLD